ncbi:hypothetical protein PAXRUDRAFT_827481 [Paxillus rubicundulus Ve08.2h10]|uniref:Uncharacterized protein n=1 Tax=Paxillus rubicundulus Ve08.2h10 TaxID=930991 RepID=A0A0D0DQT5_9AGAM|nr:hypothetical protein PAXRUDRAFT_827481 [Paxillus rubicundulus Ve08.2h10]
MGMGPASAGLGKYEGVAGSAQFPHRRQRPSTLTLDDSFAVFAVQCRVVIGRDTEKAGP